MGALQRRATTFNAAVATDEGDWIIKGFIDIARNIYTVSVDTKVVSKILELLLLPELVRFGEEHGLRAVLTEHQNHYPDVSFVHANGSRFAVDLKSTYRIDDRRANGMTLGAFTGYFRDRSSTRNITFPYGSYEAHVALGVIYSRTEAVADERRVHSLDELESIASVVRDFRFFAQEKWRIAGDRPGSGNTRNIGSVTEIAALSTGGGVFASHGEQVFDDYWRFYMNEDMARAAHFPERPYTNLRTYLVYKGRV